MHFNEIQINQQKYPQTEIYCTVSAKAGMDTEVMLEWIEVVWKPFTLSIGGPAYLILDACPSHKTAPVLMVLFQLKTVIKFIPTGFTLAAQPIDVGVNAPFKHAYSIYHQKWF